MFFVDSYGLVRMYSIQTEKHQESIIKFDGMGLIGEELENLKSGKKLRLGGVGRNREKILNLEGSERGSERRG